MLYFGFRTSLIIITQNNFDENSNSILNYNV